MFLVYGCFHLGPLYLGPDQETVDRIREMEREIAKYKDRHGRGREHPW